MISNMLTMLKCNKLIIILITVVIILLIIVKIQQIFNINTYQLSLINNKIDNFDVYFIY